MFVRRLLEILTVLAVTFVSVIAPASAQQTSKPEVHGSPPPAADADMILDADIHIDSITFHTVPKNAHTLVTGVNQAGGYRIIRTNIPAHPQAGKTYRNVRIQFQALSRFVDPNAAATASPAPRAR